MEKEEGHRKKFYTLIISTWVGMTAFYISNYSNNAWVVYYYDTAETSTYAYGEGEYLRTWTDPNLFTGEIAYKNMQEVSLLSRQGTHMRLYCEASETDGTG